MPDAANDPLSTSKARLPAGNDMVLRNPRREDGTAVHRLIESCGTLDANSLYCNFLQCTHFSQTCMLAEENGKILGWVSAYRPPEERDTLFVWQVAVAEAARGRGLARRLIGKLLETEACAGVMQIKTTITPDNQPSWRMFEGLAKSFDADVTDEVWLCRDRHFGDCHDSEHMLTIGPVGAAAGSPAQAA